MRPPPLISLTRPPLEADGSPSGSGHGVLELCSAAKSEPGAHPEEILSRIWTFDGAPQSEEGVMLYSAFPQMLASFLVSQPIKRNQIFNEPNILNI